MPLSYQAAVGEDLCNKAMNWEHFLSELNQKGKVVGGHVTNSGIVELGSRVNVGTNGLYKVAPIEINGVVKNNGSAFYPATWSGARVRYETFQAYSNRVIPDPVNNPRFWTGISPSGLEIQGYLTPRLTAYPFR